jgi:hypothetical protein
MTDSVLAEHRRPALGDLTALGVVFVLALIGYSVLSYPASVGQGGLSSLIASVGLLLAYGMAALWVRTRSTISAQTALVFGSTLGLVLGAVEAVNIALESFANLSGPLSAITGVGAMGLMVMLFGAAGSGAFRRTDSLRLAVLASVWCALVGTVITCLFGFATNLAFMPHQQRILSDAYLRSGMQDPRAFVIRNTLDSASSHLLMAPLLAVFFGFISGLTSGFLQSIPRRVVLALALVGIVQWIVSAAAIRFALTLERSQRPPFIMVGMLAGGLALASVHPFCCAVRGRLKKWPADDETDLV